MRIPHYDARLITFTEFNSVRLLAMYITLFVCVLLVVPAVIVVITALADHDSYGFHVMDKNNETL